MYQPVQTGLCKHLIAEDSVPVCNGELTGDYGRFLMVPVINDLFKVILLLTFQLKHTEVIDDYQIESFDFFEELEFMPFNAGQFKLIQLKSRMLPDMDAVELPTVSLVTKSYVVSSSTRPIDRLYPEEAEMRGANAHLLSDRDISRSRTASLSERSLILYSNACSTHLSSVHTSRLSFPCAYEIIGNTDNITKAIISDTIRHITLYSIFK